MEAYTVPGWPATMLGHSAVTPHLNRAAGGGGMAYKDRVTGEPGTRAIPTGRPPVPADRTAQATMGTARSTDAPGSFRPNLYYARPEAAYWPGAGMPVAVRSDNLMPVPATDPRGVPARLAVPPTRRGQAQIMSRPALTVWPSWNRS